MTRVALSAAAAAAAVAAVATAASPAVADEMQDATDAGVAFLATRCAAQQPLLADLAAALESGNADASRTAYVASRPPYEEIEVLATNDMLGDLDAKIDARPYAFDGGEDDPAWAGFHRVERDLYRDGNLTAAAASTAALRAAVDDLCIALTNNTVNVTAAQSLAGQVALAYEVAAKKVSSEEETFSDASLLIFKHNYRGIQALFTPFKEAGLAAEPAAAVDDAYAAVVAAYAAIDTAGVTANAVPARPYSGVTVAERAALMNATYAYADALKAAHDALLSGDAGGASAERAAVAAAAAVPRLPALAAVRIATDAFPNETAAGVAAFSTQCSKQQQVLVPLRAALEAGNMTAARTAYAAARPPYEQIETLAASFEDEDTAIDARPDAFDYGERSPEWAGLHAVERALYRDNDAGAAVSALDAVDTAVASLCEKLKDPTLFSAAGNFDGMLALSLEVPAKKISSEEETWSDLSLMIFRENAKGIAALYEPFAPVLDNATAAPVAAALANIKSLWSRVDAGNDWETGVAFRAYSNTTVAERADIHTAFMGLHRSLRVAEAELKATAPAPPSPSPDATTTAMPSPTNGDDDSDGNTCFPADATVDVAGRGAVRMDALSVGDRVRTSTGGYSPVYLFSHADADVAAMFVRLTTASGAVLRLTPTHYLPVGSGGGTLTAAGSVVVGDALTTADGSTTPVTAVARVAGVGLYNPHVLNGGQLVVDGVRTSVYTTAVAPRVASALLAPARAAYMVGGWTTGVLESGSSWAWLLPGGAPPWLGGVSSEAPTGGRAAGGVCRHVGRATRVDGTACPPPPPPCGACFLSCLSFCGCP
ncbi:hypothetical protein BU14_0060s0018 [Porphyra umbilicalis]|uniref:Hint domain-containing protein n=1 Tax=Porphyra umbilicalis TaxID=2786 RepID=A0A1X6PGU8_PORUM|nr:hypothetical protein BU14_0060s0018 [Porphyra umbilicalis]|eukprot:OSX80052.1 hypothetical protein BU14_0060s0018 [Porphyra umbilicalis]